MTSTWNKAQRQAKKSGLFSLGLMKDRRQVQDVNNLFGKMKIRLAEAMQEYNAQYDKLAGKQHDLGEGSEWDNVNKQIGRSERKVNSVQKALDKLIAHRDKLLSQKQELDLLPNPEKLQQKQVKLQGELSKINKQLNKLSVRSFSNQMDGINTKVRDAAERFDIVAKQAASLKFKDLDSENWDKLQQFVDEQSRINREQNKTLHDQIEALKQKEADLTTQLDEAMKKRKTKNNNELVERIRHDIEQNQKEMDRVFDKLNVLRVNTELTKNYQNSMTSAYQDKGRDYDTWKKGRDDLKRNTNWQVAQQSRLETFAIDKNTKVIPDSVIKELERDKERISEQIRNIKQERKNALKTEGKKEQLGLEIDKTNTHIGSVQAEMKTVTAETEAWKQKLIEVQNEIEYLVKEIALLKGDTKINPMEQEFQSDAMQPMNKATDETNRKWGALGGLMSRAKAKLAGIKGYMKQNNALTRVFHKVWQNIYSQIATLINPLNIFKRAWNDWINRFDNLAWKNTFDVIKYNLVTVIAPFLEWVAKMLLKLAAIANVFTKKWFGVDLFDKSAWQTEQMKKNLGACTLSIDELHSTTDNPDTFNTMFDKGIDPNSLLGKDFQNTLGKWADDIKNWWDGVVEDFKGINGWEGLLNFIKKHPILSAIAGLTLASLLGKLGLWPVIGALGKLAFKAFKGIAKLAWEGLKWLGPKLWEGVKWIGKKIVDPNTWKSVGTFFKGLGTKLGGFFGKELYTGMNGATVTMGKFIGGIGLVAGGVALAGTQAYKAGRNWQDYNKWQKAGAIGAVGLGSAMAGVGAVLLGASGPVGWAVAGAVALGALCIGLAQTQDGIGSVKDETEKWQAANEKLQQANQNLYQANENYLAQLGNLEQLERQTGQSGEELFKAVRDGKLDVDNMTAAQLQVYNAYVNTKKAAEDLKKAQEEQKQAAAEEAEAAIRVEIANAKESKSYDKLAKDIETAWKNGTISTEKAQELIQRAYGDMDDEARKTFKEKLPSYLTEGLDEQKYRSGFNKFGNWVAGEFNKIGKRIEGEWKTIGNNVADGWNKSGIFGAIGGFFSGLDQSTARSINELYNLKATEDDVKNSTEALKLAQENQAEIQAKVDELQKSTGQSGADLYDKIMNNKIAYNDLTASEQELVEQYVKLTDAMKKTDEAALTNVTNLASIDLQAAETSGDYSTFIDNLIAANERGEIDTNEMQNLLSQAYAKLDWDARQTFMEKIPENMRQGVEDGASQYEGRFQQMGNWLRGCWEGIKTWAGNTWEGIKNSAIGQKVKEIAENTQNKFEELKTKASEKWEQVKTAAGQKWEEIKNSAIGQKVQEIWKNTTTKFEEIKTNLGKGWETLKTNAKTAWDNIKTSIVDAAKGAWEKAKGFFEKIGEGVKKAWEGFKNFASDTGQRIGNLFSGKGWKTNSELPSYDVGTNYVPNDQLAYVHKGEAIIPAKYNKPYTGSTDNYSRETTEEIRNLTNQVREMQQMVAQGIRVQGQFVQRGADLVATVERATNKVSNTILSNKQYAR